MTPLSDESASMVLRAPKERCVILPVEVRQVLARLTRAQRIAVKHPALIAEECAHPRYGTHSALGTVVLTINTGYE